MTGTSGTADWGLGMMKGTSPAITSVKGGYQMAFQANNGILWTTGTLGTYNTGLGMAPGTSPSIQYFLYSGALVAFQANNGTLWTAKASGGEARDLGLGMAPGTSPHITGRLFPDTEGYQVLFQANTTRLWSVGTDGTADLGLGMMPGTSPS
ncbi:hypothetical protein ACWEQC_21325 [Streptomyces shenzhenensis]